MSRFEIPANVRNPLQLTDQEREKTRSEIVVGSLPSGTFFIMNFLASVIAGYGLLQNSPAVVIGAMLVAMMLGPIVGLGLAVVDRDRKLLAVAMTTLLFGVAWVVGIGIFIGLVHSRHALTDEIIGRTAPNVMDLIVALAGGFAGAIATVSTRLPVAVVGVGVATALVPPLVTCGILLSRGQWDLASGAFLLTLTNMVAIQFASAVTLWFAKFNHDRPDRQHSSFLAANWWSIALLVILATILTINLTQVATQERFDQAVTAALRAELEHDNNRLIRSEMVTAQADAGASDPITVMAYLQGDRPPTIDEVRLAQLALPRIGNLAEMRLQVRFVPVSIVTVEPSGQDKEKSK